MSIKYKIRAPNRLCTSVKSPYCATNQFLPPLVSVFRYCSRSSRNRAFARYSEQKIHSFLEILFVNLWLTAQRSISPKSSAVVDRRLAFQDPSKVQSTRDLQLSEPHTERSNSLLHLNKQAVILITTQLSHLNDRSLLCGLWFLTAFSVSSCDISFKNC